MKKIRQTPNEASITTVSRRQFFKSAALLGGSVLLCDKLAFAQKELDAAYARGENPFADPASIIHTTCMGCHAHCDIKAKIYQGVLVKLEGSPYGPNGKLPHFHYNTHPKDEALYDGKMCLKGQSGIQVQYDPYRITKVLKRAGKRGENLWKTIEFNQAVTEICEGGVLFKDVPGEENRKVEGLRDLWALRDRQVMEEMSKDVMTLLHTPQGEEKKKAVEAFKTKFSDYKGKNYLNTLIDPDHPDFGPRNNQFVWYGGRVQYGREAFYLRWFEGGFGSINWVNHCTVCGGSQRCGHAEYAMQQNPEDGQFRNEGGGKYKVDHCYFSTDFLHTEFLMLFGHLIFEANYGPTHLAERVTEGLASGRLTLVSVDPRLSKTGSKSHKWVPIKPATDGALIWAMIRWILENERYDKKFMSNANKAAAIADKETCWSNGNYLVKYKDDGPGDFLRAKDIGAVQEGDIAKVYVAQDGKIIPVIPDDVTNAVDADMFFQGEIQSKDGKTIRVKSAWQLIKEYAFSKTFEEWASICGIETETITWLAKEFTSHGKKAAADSHRGTASNAWGTMTTFSLNTLNTLIGNIDWKGGWQKGGGSWDFKGTKDHQPYSVMAKLHPGSLKPFGIPLSKQCSVRGLGHRDTTYENSTIFAGYPAKRPWYGPSKWGVYQEAIPAGAEGYPYKLKALWLACWTTPAAANGNAQKIIEALADVNKMPLLFANDIVIGESSMYADYIFPDVSYLEELQTSKWPSSNMPHKANPLRQPTVAPVVDNCKVYGQEMPISVDAVKMAIAEKLGLPGYGPDGFGPGQNFTHYDQFYLKSAADIGVGDKPGDDVPDASDEEIEIFKKAHAHLPKSVYDYDRWREAAGEQYWRKVVTIFNRGGRFQDFEKGYDGDKMGNKWAKMVNVYSEDCERTIHPGTGKRLPGIAEYRPVMDFFGNDLLAIDEKAGYPYTFITYKVVGGANFRGTAAYYWIRETLPENYVVMHIEDAEKDGLKDGDMVKLSSVSNPEGMWDLKNGRKYPCGGKLKTTSGIRKGVIGVSYHYGHWAYGSTNVKIDGEVIPGDPRRGSGINPNGIRRMDPHVKDVPPSDPIGGQESVPTKVKVTFMTEEDLALMHKHNPAAFITKEMTKTYLGGV